jgi:biotin synthase
VLTREDILSWLRQEDPAELEHLWLMANTVRQRFVGSAIHLRGLVEISNHCVRACHYCGLRHANRQLVRYRMAPDEIVQSAERAAAWSCGTVVLQAGEDPQLTAEMIASIIVRIKTRTSLAVTLSLGERSLDELRRWKASGADRYLLRFETSDRALYDLIHPPFGKVSDRLQMLREIKAMGYEAGGGVMVGIPGQTYDILAADIATFRELDLDMIGVGPFIPHPQTPLGQQGGQGIGPAAPPAEQIPPTDVMVYKMIALARLACPTANIPATTALATVNRATGRELAWQRGANVVMPNFTPLEYRKLYEIYPDKACIGEGGQTCVGCLSRRIHSLGREVGAGPGSRSEQACVEVPATGRQPWGQS